MATQLSIFTHATPRVASMQPKCRYPYGAFSVQPRLISKKNWRIKVSDGLDSYLDMWKKAVEREKQETEFRKILENVVEEDNGDETEEVLDKKSGEFQKLLEVSPEERDRVQRMQVIDRAEAAIAAARAILNEGNVEESSIEVEGNNDDDNDQGSLVSVDFEHELEAEQGREASIPVSGNERKIAPGPNFWSWTPPQDNVMISDYEGKVEAPGVTSPSINHTVPVMELVRSVVSLSIPFESKLENFHNPPLPPLQSLARLENVEMSSSITKTPDAEVEHEIDIIFSDNAVEAANALIEIESPEGNHPDGSRWWKETGTEVRPDGVVCRWTVKRGVSADKAVEWEEKYWEAADEFDYKELGSEKSGRDSSGNVWREFWKESMYQKDGSLHLEKTADKWGKNGEGSEWQEKWWESYGASGQAEKWAHKWCSIDPNTSLEAGHAHVWHERWGEQYDGKGGSTKYTDKWAERCEGESWAKWGDKWDEHFDTEGHGVKQGETWWEGKHGERWNKTWGEGHNGSGWVHKYGKSSSGEHWDTHEEQDTWYEKFPHYGFYHCFENSVQLRDVKKPSE
ncbi:Protein RNA-directed DNA methylation like [Heracleum sosnowskyi]|uniref:Protein RNA-directed DNA methylation like n=1 Tax=Heracleum sosnowskyi TaxID=360622 RepID=A0AAD8MZ93_9APIA|nr:Protein RNA-directed DNA methylation like [Heracleum sosnowskyi]